MNATSHFETAKAKRYLGTLCKHFGHKVPTGLEESSGWVELPFARCDMTADETGLSLVVSAKNQSDLQKATRLIGSHLERFAFRENPELVWRPDVSASA